MLLLHRGGLQAFARTCYSALSGVGMLPCCATPRRLLFGVPRVLEVSWDPRFNFRA